VVVEALRRAVVCFRDADRAGIAVTRPDTPDMIETMPVPLPRAPG